MALFRTMLRQAAAQVVHKSRTTKPCQCPVYPWRDVCQWRKGVVQDDVTAVKWFTKAAQQGNASAQFNLGLMYANGEGVVQDDVTAVKWYTKAAQQGVPVPVPSIVLA